MLGRCGGRDFARHQAGDIPVEQPTKFHLAVNLATKALGLTIPEGLLARAGEVIELAGPLLRCLCLLVARLGKCRSPLGMSGYWGKLQEGFVDLAALRSCISVSGL
jgi:hypothetical protein